MEEDPPPEEAVGEEAPPAEAEPEASPASPSQNEVEVADHMPTEGADADQGDGQPRRESTLGEIPVVKSSVIEQLRNADQEARDLMALMAKMRQSIEELQNKPHMTEEDTRILEEKQMELLKKLSEFETITKKMQVLVGLSGISLPQVEPSEEPAEKQKGKDVGTGESDEKSIQLRESDLYCKPEDLLPQLVCCGFAHQLPKILICETGYRPKPKPKLKCPMFLTKMKPTKPQPQCCTCGLQQHLWTKDNTIDLLKKKMRALEIEMEHTEDENFKLSKQLEKAYRDKCCPPVCPPPPRCLPPPCVPQCSQKEPPRCPPLPCVPPKCPPKCAVGSEMATKQNLNAVCLQSQLNMIELEVQHMRSELCKAQKEQQELEDQEELLKCAAPKCMTASSSDITPCACVPPLPTPDPPKCECIRKKQ